MLANEKKDQDLTFFLSKGNYIKNKTTFNKKLFGVSQ